MGPLCENKPEEVCLTVTSIREGLVLHNESLLLNEIAQNSYYFLDEGEVLLALSVIVNKPFAMAWNLISQREKEQLWSGLTTAWAEVGKYSPWKSSSSHLPHLQVLEPKRHAAPFPFFSSYKWNRSVVLLLGKVLWSVQVFLSFDCK